MNLRGKKNGCCYFYIFVRKMISASQTFPHLWVKPMQPTIYGCCKTASIRVTRAISGWKELHDRRNRFKTFPSDQTETVKLTRIDATVSKDSEEKQKFLSPEHRWYFFESISFLRADWSNFNLFIENRWHWLFNVLRDSLIFPFLV